MEPYSRKKLDLTGQRFGKLTVIGPAENIKDRTAWTCRCDCGAVTVVRTGHLRNGHVTSCGECTATGVESLTYVEGTCVEMIQAKTVRRNNTSGVSGVDWRPSKGTWRASICFKGKRYHLGSYRVFEDAVRVRRRAEEELHGNFLREFAEREKAAGTGS